MSSSPTGLVTRSPIRDPIDKEEHKWGTIHVYLCDVCGDETYEPFSIGDKIQICDRCAREVAELWNHEHSGKWILYQENDTGGRPKHEYVYLARSSTGEHKIGWSTQPERRVGKFDTKMPVEIELVTTFIADDGRKAESHLHNKYSHKRVKGEWFDLDGGDIRAICAISSFQDNQFRFRFNE